MGRKKGSLGKKNRKELIDFTKVACASGDKKHEDAMIETVLPELTKEQEERQDRLNNALRSLNKTKGLSITYGKNIPAFERQLFGYKCIDKLTNGGIKRGQYSTLWGDPDSGKTSIAYKMIATAQKEGRTVVYINMETGYDSIYAKKYEVDVDKLLVENCTTAEQALDTIIRLCSENVVDLIVLDSIHGLSPRGEQFVGKTEEMKSMNKDTQALLARKLSEFFRKSIPYVSKAKCAVLLIGQTRTTVGEYVNIEVLTGGRAIKHYSRLILHIRRGSKADAPVKKEKKIVKELNEEGDEVEITKTIETIIGFNCVIKVDKSQIEGCKYLDEIRVPFISGEGIKE